MLMKNYRIHRLASKLHLTFFLLLAAVLTCAKPAVSLAAEGGWAVTDFTSARLISAVEGTGELDKIPLALEVRLEPGWKAYWRAPGDAGLPPYFDWAGSENLDQAAISWPLPERHTLQGFETFGYEGETLFPIDVTPQAPGAALDAKLSLQLMICKDICVPQNMAMALSLPEGPAETSAQANQIERWRARVPGSGKLAGIDITHLGTAALDDGTPALHLNATADPAFEKDIDVFVETASGISFARPQVSLADDRASAQITVPLAGQLLEGEIFEDDVLRNEPVTITLVTGHGDNARAMEYTAEPADGPPPAQQSAHAPTQAVQSLWAILITAFIGGVILNLMPCVLPVLSLKLLYAVSHEDAPPARIRAGFMAAAAGIITSFLLIALILAGMKSAGAAVGWGIQFQHPAFLALMAVIVSLFACNMWGLFEIPLPRFIAERAGRSDDHGEHEPTIAGHFATGMLATALATPCTAPFVGTAVGFALAGSAGGIIAIFATMGAGLALPYLLVAAAPSLAHKLPKPGKWMLHVKAVLGVALLGTAVWLLWVLAGQAGTTAAWLCAAFILIGMLAVANRAKLPAASAVITLLMLGAIAAPAFMQPPEAGTMTVSKGKWAAFDPERIPSHVADGKTVFVDITADWCLTCKANKKFVLSQPDVHRALQAENIVAMQGDWTRPDEVIRAYLAQHKRYGIPFNMVYGPGAPEGIVLPELLGADDVLDAIEKAGSGCKQEMHTC